jgi:hypothetical protein
MAIAIRGRVSISRRPRREHWQALLEAQRRSGLSLAAFCRRRGVHKGTLSFWKWKLAREAESAASRGATGSFVPIHLAMPPRARESGTTAATVAEVGELEITLAGGQLVRVRGRVDPAWLGAVFRELEVRRC